MNSPIPAHVAARVWVQHANSARDTAKSRNRIMRQNLPSTNLLQCGKFWPVLALYLNFAFLHKMAESNAASSLQTPALPSQLPPSSQLAQQTKTIPAAAAAPARINRPAPNAFASYLQPSQDDEEEEDEYHTEVFLYSVILCH